MNSSKENINVTVGNRIRDLRESKGLTQEAFRIKLQTEDVSVSKNTYSRYENGDSSIPIDFLYAVSCYFDTTIDYLITGKKPSLTSRIETYSNVLLNDEKEKMKKLLVAIADSLYSDESE